MIPDEDMIKAALVNIEEDIDKHGWDEPPRLFMIVERGADLLFSPMPFPKGGPGDVLEELADGITSTGAGRMLTAGLARREFVGLMFVAESWANFTVTPKEFDALKRKGKGLADLPDSVESRDAHIVDVGGRIIGLHRQRGRGVWKTWDQPAGADGTSPEPKQWLVTGGRIVESLRTVVLAVSRKMPAGSADVAALEALTFETNEEAQRRLEEHEAAGKSRVRTREEAERLLFGESES